MFLSTPNAKNLCSWAHQNSDGILLIPRVLVFRMNFSVSKEIWRTKVVRQPLCFGKEKSAFEQQQSF